MITPTDLKNEELKREKEKQEKELSDKLKKEQNRIKNLEYYLEKATELINNPEKLENFILFCDKEGCCGTKLGYRKSYGLIQGENYRRSKKLDTYYFHNNDPQFSLGFDPEPEIEATGIFLKFIQENGYQAIAEHECVEDIEYDWEGGPKGAGTYHTEYYIKLTWK